MKLEIIPSQEERCHSLLQEAFNICYEDNPLREGWDLHKVDCDVVITKDEYDKPGAYYLIEVYLSKDLTDQLFSITEGFPRWLETYTNGRTSIYAMLNVFTPEVLEDLLTMHEASLKNIRKARNNFIQLNQEMRA